MTTECTVPPDGWRCTRGSGHDGPCAAIPVEPLTSKELPYVDKEDVLNFLGELLADYVDREQLGKADLVGDAINLITGNHRLAVEPSVSFGTALAQHRKVIDRQHARIAELERATQPPSATQRELEESLSHEGAKDNRILALEAALDWAMVAVFEHYTEGEAPPVPGAYEEIEQSRERIKAGCERLSETKEARHWECDACKTVNHADRIVCVHCDAWGPVETNEGQS